MKNPLLESYKGVRDFYPEDQFYLDYIKETMSRVCERYGYEHYGASILEHAELYKGKSSEEIVNEQTYIFKDRGGREVVLRPEMTPTVARMVAKKRRELGFPLRLYSIPNVFRYERPQRGRLREHWQLNVDLFGADSKYADAEIIKIAYDLLIEFGASKEDFVIKLNSREVIDKIFKGLEVPPLAAHSVLRLLDRKDKMPQDEFKDELKKILAKETDEFLETLESRKNEGELVEFKDYLAKLGVDNIVIDTSIVRGFDYYTGMVFEIFDTNKENPRALFGGGRYNKLMDALGEEELPAVGFGAGDVTIKDFLEIRGLLPEYRPATELAIVLEDFDEETILKAEQIASKLRMQDVNTAVNYSFKKPDKQLKNVAKQKVPFVLFVNSKALKENAFKVKNLKSGEIVELTLDEIASFIFESEI